MRKPHQRYNYKYRHFWAICINVLKNKRKGGLGFGKGGLSAMTKGASELGKYCLIVIFLRFGRGIMLSKGNFKQLALVL